MSAPLSVKLGLKPGSKWSLYNSPPSFVDGLVPLPAGCTVTEGQDLGADGRIVFALEQVTFQELFLQAFAGLGVKDVLWIAWPKKSSNVPTDMSFEVVQSLALSRRLVDNKVCAIDDVWTALRFVVTVQARANWKRPGLPVDTESTEQVET